jgi:hypothetical protein
MEGTLNNNAPVQIPLRAPQRKMDPNQAANPIQQAAQNQEPALADTITTVPANQSPPAPAPAPIEKSGNSVLFFLIPFIVGTTLVFGLLADAYLSGLHFRASVTHFFITAIETMTLLLAAVALPISTARWFTEKSLTASGKIQAIMLNVLLVPLFTAAVFVFGPAYEMGLERSYGQLDATQLVTDCRELTPGQTIKDSDPEFDKLPEYIKSLQPEVVKVGDGRVKLVFDADEFTAARDAGVLIFLKDPPEGKVDYATKHHMQILSAQYPVFRFRGDGF